MRSRSVSLGQGEYRTLVVFSSLALLFTIGTITLSVKNRAALRDVSERQQYINASIKLSRLNSQLIQGLAAVSAQTGDRQIRDLLSSHGISFSANKTQSRSK